LTRADGEVRALEGVRVLDLGNERIAFATRILADLGADVILVEPPQGGAVRRLAPFLDDQPGPERGYQHLYLNANKRSAAIDLNDAAAADRLRGLVASADVLVETGRPGELAMQGLGYDELRALNAGLIYVSVTPFGLDSEWAERAANDLVASASGGLLWVSGEPEHPPTHGAADPAYKMASLVAATGVMLALAGRDADPQGRGCHLDISMQEAVSMAVLQTANPNILAWNGRVPGRPGMSGAYRCADGKWAFINPRPDRFAQFISMLDAAGIEHHLGPDDWQLARAAPGDVSVNPVPALVEQLAAVLTREEFLEQAWAGDQLAMPIMNFADMAEAEHFAVNEQFREVDHDALGGALSFVRSPVDAMSGEVPIRRAPTLGEHTAEVLDSLDGLAAPSGRSVAPERPAGELLTPLTGIRVVDFSWVLAGPLGTRILANFGAEVIRIESRARIDGVRNGISPDGTPSENLGTLFNDVNTGKRSLTLDLTTERGIELVRELIATADVVTNNFRPGVLERIGLGYDDLCAIKPDIVLLNMPGCGRNGPWAERRTMGNLVMHAAGFSSLMGFPGGRTRGLGVAYPDFTSPYLMAITVLAALRERARTGEGQELDLSQLSATISLIGADWMHWSRSGEQPPPPMNRDANFSPHGVYPTQGDDEWCAIAVEDDAQWAALCEAVGDPAAAVDPRFASHATRKQNEDALDALVASWVASHDRWALATLLQQHGIAAAAVESLRDTLEHDPQLQQHYQRVIQPSDPDVEVVIDRDAIRFAGVEHTLERAPMMGEHNEYVLRELLGVSQADFDAMVVEGVIN
jgi:crotonobetainyl-CoA:carnitine CoA-transferase CaiB-like acyl-CoA transferase